MCKNVKILKNSKKIRVTLMEPKDPFTTIFEPLYLFFVSPFRDGRPDPSPTLTGGSGCPRGPSTVRGTGPTTPRKTMPRKTTRTRKRVRAVKRARKRVRYVDRTEVDRITGS